MPEATASETAGRRWRPLRSLIRQASKVRLIRFAAAIVLVLASPLAALAYIGFTTGPRAKIATLLTAITALCSMQWVALQTPSVGPSELFADRPYVQQQVMVIYLTLLLAASWVLAAVNWQGPSRKRRIVQLCTVAILAMAANYGPWAFRRSIAADLAATTAARPLLEAEAAKAAALPDGPASTAARRRALMALDLAAGLDPPAFLANDPAFDAHAQAEVACTNGDSASCERQQALERTAEHPPAARAKALLRALDPWQ